MKKIILFMTCLVSIAATAQSVATTSMTSNGKWKFGGQVISVKYLPMYDADNKTVITTWNYWDTVNHVIIKTDKFIHTDTAFNSFWNNYNGFYDLYEELRIKEGLPVGDSTTIEQMFYNKHIPNLTEGIRIKK